MEAAYDPVRMDGLHRRTAEAIDALTQMSSSDPAAEDALRIVRLTRRNLEDHWMAAIRDIERSDAMVRWRSITLLRPLSAPPGEHRLPDHLSSSTGPPPGPLSDGELASLLGRLEFLERRAAAADGTPERADSGVATRAIDSDLERELDALARDLAVRIPDDRVLRDELLALAPTNMLVAQLLGRASFPPSFGASVVTAMATANGPDNGIDRDRYATALSTALASVVSDPGACLDLLATEPTVVQALAGLEHLDQFVVSDVVVSGLHEGVRLRPERLGDGLQALEILTRLANGPLDTGVTAGMAIGIATSLPTYLDVLAVAVNATTDDSLFIVSDRSQGIEVAFGNYPDVVGLFGALLRDEDARGTIGAETAAWTARELEAAGSPLELDAALTTSAQFTQLLIDAGVAEQHQMRSEAAESEQRKQTAGSFALTGADTALTIAPLPSPVRLAIGVAAERGMDWLARTTPEIMPGRSIGPEIHRQMITTTVSISLVRPTAISGGSSIPTLTSGQRRTIENDLAAIEGEHDPEERERLVSRLVSYIRADVPAMGPALRLVSNNAATANLPRRPEASQ